MTGAKSPARVPVGKKMRFEIFKRDNFTCQYCGSKAPDVVLHADHIKPVVEGGLTEVLNLITACEACNLGKGRRALGDRSVVQKQRAQIEELEARREQLEMMLAWRDGAKQAQIDEALEISNRIEAMTGYSLTKSGLADVSKLIKANGFSVVLESADAAFEQYGAWDGDEFVASSFGTAFSKMGAIARFKKKHAGKPYMLRLTYIQGIMRNRFGNPHSDFLPVLEDAHTDKGWPLDMMEAAAKVATSLKDFGRKLSAMEVRS